MVMLNRHCNEDMDGQSNVALAQSQTQWNEGMDILRFCLSVANREFQTVVCA